MPAGTKAISLPDTAFGSYFLTVFGRPESTTACECERTQNANLAQCLHLLNSKDVQSKLSDQNGRASAWSAKVAGSGEVAGSRTLPASLLPITERE